MSQRPFCVKGGEIIGNVPTIEELASYIKDYILNDAYSSEWGTDVVKGATRQALYNMFQTVVGQLEYKGLWDASSENYPSNPELGWYYVVSVAGEVGGVYYYVGDWIIWNGTSWDKLAGQRDVLPIGTILMYDGTGIVDVGTRETQIGDEIGDIIKMIGWYVCNGLADTPNLKYKFLRGEFSSGTIGGSQDAVVVEHTHNVYKYYASGSTHLYMETPVSGLSQLATGVITTEGVSGVNKNLPPYYEVIFIIKKG